MKKIASNHDFQRELHKVLALCQGPKRPSRQRIAARLRGLANRLQGKTASLTDDDTLEQLVQMEMESMGEEGEPSYEAMGDVDDAASDYEDAVESALTTWVKQNMDQLAVGERGPLQRVRRPADVVSVMMDLGGGAPYLYFMEAEGHGVGSWDGRWDKMFLDHRSSLKELSRFVLGKTRGAYQKLKDAIMEAAMSGGAEDY